jgi:glutamate dehydrogenase (NADP+)
LLLISGPDGYVYDPNGITGEKVDYLLELRATNNDVVEPYAHEFGAKFIPRKTALGNSGECGHAMCH